MHVCSINCLIQVHIHMCSTSVCMWLQHMCVCLCACVYTSALVSWFSKDQRERCTHISTGGTDHFAEPGCNYVILHNPNPGWAKGEREKYAHIGAGSTGH